MTQQTSHLTQSPLFNNPSELEALLESPLGSIRDGIGKALVDLGHSNPAVVTVSADLTESTRLNWFQEAFPERFVQVGVAEQNQLGVAAGLALGGKIPFAASYAVFSPGRSWDQLRVSVCYSNLPVKLIGGHAGLTVGEDGATHQALEDIAMTRVLPNLTVLVPADEAQAYAATIAAANHPGPVYIRSSRIKSQNITSAATPFQIGRAQTLLASDDDQVTIIAIGTMVALALEAARQLASQDISARVINLPTIKPLDSDTILTAARQTKAIVTIEEHQIHGGLGSAVAEITSQHYPIPLKIIGMPDTFGESGSAQKLLEKYGLTTQAIVEAAQKMVH